MSVTKRTRYEVLKRDNHTCRYCGGAAPDVQLTVDHVTPVALGGSDDPSNLVAACRDCNYGKASTNPDAAVVEDVANDALRWAAAMQEAARMLTLDTRARLESNGKFHDLWVAHVHKWNGEPAWRPDDWPETLDTFRKRGLNDDELEDAVWIALGKRLKDDTWRYFCGICWKKVERIQEAARALIEAEEQ